MSNEKKSKTLGMPHGTANGRLRKNILFHLLKKHNENHCIRCGDCIETVNDLSIEHIKPWEGISVELFWDIDNIAFSHRRCNVPHRQNGGAKFTPGPEGTAFCGVHQEYMPKELFYKHAGKISGVHYACKECYDKRRRPI